MSLVREDGGKVLVDQIQLAKDLVSLKELLAKVKKNVRAEGLQLLFNACLMAWMAFSGLKCPFWYFRVVFATVLAVCAWLSVQWLRMFIDSVWNYSRGVSLLKKMKRLR